MIAFALIFLGLAFFRLAAAIKIAPVMPPDYDQEETPKNVIPFRAAK